MIQNSAYGDPMLEDESVFRQIYQQNQTMYKMDTNEAINNNNNHVANRNISYNNPYQDDDHYYDGTTPEQEHSPEDSQRNYAPTKTDDDCMTVSCTSQTGVSQPKDELTQDETVEITDNVSTVELMDQTDAVHTPVAAVKVTKKKDKAKSQTVQRRPMNAFLLFCKLHRTTLKNHFLEENRTITVKLGKWWRHLTDDQKRPYRKLSEEYKKKMYVIDPNYQWCKRAIVPAIAQAPPCTNGASANTSLAVVETDQINVPDPTISEERLEAAKTLVSLHESVEVRALTTFKLADESDMGSLNELCIGTGTQQSGDSRTATGHVAWESRCNQPTEVIPCTSGLGGLANQAVEGASAPRATRLCKGKWYKAIMSQMFPRAKSKRAKTSKMPPITPIKQRKTARDQTNCYAADPNLINLTQDELLEEFYTKVAKLPAVSIDHFLYILNIEKTRKKSQSASVSNDNRSESQSPTGPMLQDDVPAAIAVAEDHTVVSTPIGTVVQEASPEALAMGHPSSTKLVGSCKRKSPKERITQYPQSAMEKRQTILICHMPDASDGTCHARAGL